MGFRYATGRLYKQRVAGGGWWDLDGAISGCIAAYQPIGAASYAASKVNLANPGTYDATEGDAPSWTVDNGWDFDAANDYLDTGITPENDQTWSMIIRFDQATTGNLWIAGVYETTTAGFGIKAGNLAQTYTQFYNGQRLEVLGMTNSGVLAIAGSNAFKDGSDVGDIGSGGGSITNQIAIGGVYSVGVIAALFDGRIQATAIYDIDISAYVSDLTTAMNAL